MTKNTRFWGFHGLGFLPVPSDMLKNGRVVPNWRLGVAAPLASDFRFNGFRICLFSGGHIFGSSGVELNFLNFLGQ
jgi:hypothetical protein